MGFVLGGIALLVLVVGLAKSAGGSIISRTPAAGPPGPDGLPDLAAEEMPAALPAPAPAPLPPAPTARATQRHVEQEVSAVLREAAQHPEQPPARVPPAAPLPTPAPPAATLTPMRPPVPGIPGSREPTPLPGYNTEEAHRLAGPLAQHIASRRNRYDHMKVRAFQAAAGIPADGIYGPNTRVALAHYGVRNPPTAMRT